MTLTVSDPQRLTMSDFLVPGVVKWVRDKGLDVHEFSTAFVNRTAELGYAPDIKMAAEEFVRESVNA